MRIAVIDIETTGLDPSVHEMIEIAVILTENNYEVARKQWMVKPSRIETADPKALKVNGYEKIGWDTYGKPLATVMSELSDFCADCTFAAWNATFDWSFIGKAFSDTGVKDPFHHRRLCIMSMTYQYTRALDRSHLDVPSIKDKIFSLADACNFFGIAPEPKVHRAMNGALKAYQVACVLYR